MIRSEVIVVLNNLRNYYNIRQGGEEYTQALDFAISSLLTDEAYQLEYEKPPIIDWNNCHATETLISLDVYKQVCAERDIAIKQLHELGYEFGQKIETTPKNDLGVDAVSRQAVLDLMIQKWGENFSGDSAMQESIDAIRVLPSVTLQAPNTGHWTDDGYCSCCNKQTLPLDISGYASGYDSFCPNCGAKMVEP